MKTLDIVLFSTAIALLFIVGYRMNLIRLDQKFILNIAPTIFIAAALFYLNFRGNPGTASAGIRAGGTTFLSLVPMLLVAFWAMGEGMVLIRTYQAEVMESLRGGRGIAGSVFSGFAIPSSIAGLPIVKELWDAGGSKEILLVFLISSSLLNWQLVLFRQPMLGWTITAVSFAASLAASAAVAVAVWGWILMTNKPG